MFFSADATIKVKGFVRTLKGCVISGAETSLGASDSKYPSETTTTNAPGYYEFDNVNYNAFWLKMEKKSSLLGSEGYTFFEYMPIRADINLTESPFPTNEIWVNFTTVEAYNVVLQLYDSQGNLLRESEFSQYHNHWVKAATEDMLETEYAFVWLDDMLSFNNLAEKLPAIVSPVNSTCGLFVFFEVPGFGKTFHFVLNGSMGYTSSVPGDVLVVNINYDAAKTQLDEILSRQTEDLQQGYTIPSEFQDLVQSANASLQKAKQQYGVNGTLCALYSLTSLNYSLHAGEVLVLDVANQRIAKIRKTNFSVKVVDRDGNPISDANVNIQLSSQDFLFEAFQAYPIPVMNYAVNAGLTHFATSFAWKFNEPNPGNYTWDEQDAVCGYPQFTNVFKLRATALFYMFQGPYGLMPDYLNQYSFEELKEVVYNHVCKVVERYADVVDWWKAINEAYTRYSNALGLTRSQVTELKLK